MLASECEVWVQAGFGLLDLASSTLGCVFWLLCGLLQSYFCLSLDLCIFCLSSRFFECAPVTGFWLDCGQLSCLHAWPCVVRQA